MIQLKFIGGKQKALPKSYSTQKSDTAMELLLAYGCLCFEDDHWEALNNVYECQSYWNSVLFVVIILPPCSFLQDKLNDSGFIECWSSEVWMGGIPWKVTLTHL